MSHSTESKLETIQANQNELLYDAVKYSSIGSISAAFVLLYAFGASASNYLACGVLGAVYLIRWIDSQYFKRDPTVSRNVAHWYTRFAIGAIASALAWASTMWILYPSDPGFQCLLVLTLTGVAAGSLASLSYDRKIPFLFQVIVFLSIESRLLVAGDSFSLQIALFNLFIFGFLLACSNEVSKNYQQLLRLRLDSQERNQSLIKTAERIAKVGCWQWDLYSKNIELSDNLALMWGVEHRTVSIERWMSMVHRSDVARLTRDIESEYSDDNEVVVEYRMVNREDDSWRVMNQITKCVVDSSGNAILLGTVRDITDIKSAEEKIYRMAFYDELTSLSNRAHFNEQLKTHIALARRADAKLAIVFIDLDDFKGINDSYGHEVGDQYLRMFAKYIKSSVRASDITARLGGDEFCIVLYGVRDKGEVARITELCLEFCKQTLEIGNHRIQPKMSVGVSLYPDDGVDQDELIRSADMAMYSVKQNGKQGYCFFDPKMVCETVDRVKLEASLRAAIDNDEFELWYQPKIALSNCRVSGVEALIRWRHPERGLIPPDLFIATAERVGMINEIGNWVLNSACEQLREWNDAGIRLQMAINISGGHFVEEGFCTIVEEALRKFAIQRGDLEIEITESMTRNPDQHNEISHQLRAMGVRIAIDDFGTGYSSLSVLDKLEVDTLKIDRSFIMGLPEDKSSILLVQAIMELSLGMGYDVVAEGVETVAQLEHLQALNCPYVQGFYFSKPVTRAEIPSLINFDWSCREAA